ncbi:CC/Se motif family (seleno)protein [Fonticella tunisiensis]|uniref:Fe-S cluster assembly iron-binding protein IscA n=1 Tax=Fonticella tunisiensis TaxID=1096341 RepID=A0A4R7KXB1_9CLOT|nr:CC/Se motif family (seleno)protein [Fonticella tunisiensis]TDT63650.1 hypothetical protein EDD71_10177 [Fonticella tunisiensis]
MKLEVDRAAIEYIKEKGAVISVDLYTSKSCCITITEPVVTFGKPELTQQFNEYTIDDIKIYVSKFIHLRDDIMSIKLNKFLGIKNISVSGVKML